MSNKTFIRVTNQMIYERLETIDNKISNLNGTTKWHTWAISMIILILAALISAAIN